MASFSARLWKWLRPKGNVGKQEGEQKRKEEKLSKREQEQKKPDKLTEPSRASAAGSSSPPRQPPPPGPATHIHDLPDEVLEQIFAPLNLKTIVKVLSVCQRWQSVIEDRNLIKNLKFEHRTFSTQEALSLIRSAPNLKSLDLFGRSDAVALLHAASARCRSLLRLSADFGYTRVSVRKVHSVTVMEALRRVFQNNPGITHLHLNVYIVDGLQFYQELCAALPDLRKLEFHIGPLSDLELDALIDGFSRNQMEEFKARFNSCSDAQVAKLVQFWGRSLRVLELKACRLSDGALALLGGCSELRRLRLIWLCSPGDWLRGLAALAHLEDLVVAESHEAEIEPEKWCRLFSQSRSSLQLRKLSLRGGSGVDDRVLASVATFCPQLEELEVFGVDITISGVREVLWCCRKMHTLDLCGMDASVANIVPELPQLAPQLRRIDIGDDARRSLGKAALRRVRAQMPHLRIL